MIPFPARRQSFKVTLQKFTRPSELTDEWVTSNTDYKSVDEYKKSVRDNLEKQAATTADNELYATAWSQVLEHLKSRSIQRKKSKKQKKIIRRCMSSQQKTMT